MRIKINQANLNIKSSSKNDIYRKFRNEFQTLTHTSSGFSDAQFRKETYIPVKEYHDELDLVLSGIHDSLTFVLGYTGVGKSTLVTNYFNIYNNNAIIREQKIFFPLLCNPTIFGTIDDVHKRVIVKLVSLRKELVDTYGTEEEKHESIIKNKEFYEFIKKNKKELLSFGKLFDESPVDELLNLEKEHRFALEILALKFYSDKYKIENIIIVLDDIESLTLEFEFELIRNVLEICECLLNKEGMSYLFKISCIIAMRQSTYNKLREKTDEYPWFSAFKMLKNEIILDKPPSLYELFTKRVSSTAKRSTPVNQESWNEALKIAYTICQTLFTKWDTTLLQLNNFSISYTMKDFFRILTNRFWLQRNPAMVRDAFRISEQDFFFNNNDRVLKALACDENLLYSAEDENSDFPIKNILENEISSQGYEPLFVYIFKFFKKTGINSIVTSSLYDNYFKDVFDGLLTEKTYYKYIKSLHKQSLIEFLPTTDKEISKKQFALLPRFKTLWRLLESNSLLLDVWREDIWLPIEHGFIFKPTDKMTMLELFKDKLNYIRLILSQEQKLILSCNRRQLIDLYINCFGYELISHVLLTSVKKSIDGLKDNVIKISLKNDIYDIIAEIDEFSNRISRMQEVAHSVN